MEEIADCRLPSRALLLRFPTRQRLVATTSVATSRRLVETVFVRQGSALLLRFSARQRLVATGRALPRRQGRPEGSGKQAPAAGVEKSGRRFGLRIGDRRAVPLSLAPTHPISLTRYHQPKGLWKGSGGTCSPQERFHQNNNRRHRWRQRLRERWRLLDARYWPQAASYKLQATSYKLQAASQKLRASSRKPQGSCLKPICVHPCSSVVPSSWSPFAGLRVFRGPVVPPGAARREPRPPVGSVSSVVDPLRLSHSSACAALPVTVASAN